jgi:hypothetical protein
MLNMQQKFEPIPDRVIPCTGFPLLFGGVRCRKPRISAEESVTIADNFLQKQQKQRERFWKIRSEKICGPRGRAGASRQTARKSGA